MYKYIPNIMSLSKLPLSETFLVLDLSTVQKFSIAGGRGEGHS